MSIQLNEEDGEIAFIMRAKYKRKWNEGEGVSL